MPKVPLTVSPNDVLKVLNAIDYFAKRHRNKHQKLLENHPKSSKNNTKKHLKKEHSKKQQKNALFLKMCPKWVPQPGGNNLQNLSFFIPGVPWAAFGASGPPRVAPRPLRG